MMSLSGFEEKLQTPENNLLNIELGQDFKTTYISKFWSYILRIYRSRNLRWALGLSMIIAMYATNRKYQITANFLKNIIRCQRLVSSFTSPMVKMVTSPLYGGGEAIT